MKRLGLILVIVACFAVPATAHAQNDGYNDVAGAVQGGSDGTSGSTPAGDTQAVASTGTTTDDGGSLPFTGLELGLILGAGVVLLGTGLLLRRVRTE